MPDENGTESTRPDAPSADESLFGEAAEKADDAPAAVEEQDSKGNTEKDAQDAADDGDKPDTEAETDTADELKVVVSIKGGRAVIGVQQPSSDPHIETFDDHDLSELAQEVTAVAERAKARWEETPKHPAYERPAPPAKRRNNRRQQGAAQDANAETETDQTQQTLRLF
ncbi:MAG: hypothetical protein F4Y50_11735 [Dehalococcoidia bacterium]|nr:hypothetical protein [Dehalococcoidia bacterium]